MSNLIEVKLLGEINEKFKDKQGARVVSKYVIAVTAAKISQLLRYKKFGKKNPYQIEALSQIKLDPVAQRGFTLEGYALQDESKVTEIKETLLGTSKENARLFVGTLVWNVRLGGENQLKKIIQIDPSNPLLPPVANLHITTDTIWLTDSAHRHFGIVEAVAAWTADKSKYPDFSDQYEFSVDLYHLDAVQERALFRELNAKQKKISASKSQQTDTGSSLGLLKSTILALDQSDQKLFDQNIEVNSNENSTHTLITMSVFTASVQNMFGKVLIEEAKQDDILRVEIAQYYCDFFYKLKNTIKVKVEHRNALKEVSPFQNLYESIIAPVMDKVVDEVDEQKKNDALNDARNKAKDLNQDIQREEKIHSNAVIKALSNIGGKIMHMKNWERVIDVLQTDLIAGNGGQYFQKTNLMLQQSTNGAPPIAIKKADGSINIQVQDQTIREIENHLTEKLSLVFTPKICVLSSGNVIEAPTERVSYTQSLNRQGDTYFDVEVEFEVGSNLSLSNDQIRLRLEVLLPSGVQWKNTNKVGKQKLLPTSVVDVPGYDHPIYPGGFKRYSVKFEITLPQYTDPSPASMDLAIDVEIPQIDGENCKIRRLLTIQPS